MAAKYLYSLADENQDLKKQIGCMTGVFQIFNRHHILSRRRVFSHSSKRGDPDSFILNNGTPQRDSSVMGQRQLTVEKHRVSTESSSSASMKLQNLDLRDVVKDSLYREARGLSHDNIVMTKASSDWYGNESRELPRSKSCLFRDKVSSSVCKDYPRFSLDSRERSFKPSNLKSNYSRNLKVNSGLDADKDPSRIRPTGVVEKLMGLETFRRRKKPDMKPISRVPVESAPWKQQDGNRVIRSSVYGEMDKRVKNLEFAESGKDLRALKHILHAMQAAEARKDERRGITDHDNQNTPCVTRDFDVSRGHESHIVIMKPKKLVKTPKDIITDSIHGERRSRPSTSLTSSSKPRKQSKKHQSESRSTPDIVKVTGEPLTPEYPSPVSVLDDSICVDNSPSPRKHTPITKTDDAVKVQNEATIDVQSKTISRALFQTKCEKLMKVDNLVQKLKNLNSSHDESHTGYTASVCEDTKPDDRYISEIFLASGLLFRDLESFELHPSGHPINPELFLVLEHTKFSNLPKEKFHRKLIFDAVNEILVGKLSSVSGMMMQDPRKLLKEVCLEIEQLHVEKKREDALKSILWEDLLKKSESWRGFYGESPMIAMDVERLILMDLVNEVVMN